jgi:hypothetical protein
MHGVFVAGAIAAVVHFSGMIQTIAPTLGAIGTILSTTDKVVADITGMRNYIAAQKAKHPPKFTPIKPLVIPKKDPAKS